MQINTYLHIRYLMLCKTKIKIVCYFFSVHHNLHGWILLGENTQKHLWFNLQVDITNMHYRFGVRKCIQQGCIKLIVKAFITKDLYFKENSVVLNFLFIKES